MKRGLLCFDFTGNRLGEEDILNILLIKRIEDRLTKSQISEAGQGKKSDLNAAAEEVLSTNYYTLRAERSDGLTQYLLDIDQNLTDAVPQAIACRDSTNQSHKIK